MKTVLVTGGAGFVGSSLCIAISESRPDIDVVALDNLKRRGSELNLSRLQEAGVKFLHGRVRNPEDIEAAEHFDAKVEYSAHGEADQDSCEGRHPRTVRYVPDG